MTDSGRASGYAPDANTWDTLTNVPTVFDVAHQETGGKSSMLNPTITPLGYASLVMLSTKPATYVGGAQSVIEEPLYNDRC